MSSHDYWSACLYAGDAFAFLNDLENKSFDLVITDPPYESLEKWRKRGTTTRLKVSKASSNEWFPVISNSTFPVLLQELYRVLKPNSHCYIFCDSPTAFHLVPAGCAAGFTFHRPLIWDKVHMGLGRYRARYENILFFEKGKRKLNSRSVPDIFSVPRVFRGFPTEKPTALMEVLIKQSSNPEDAILDPFMGVCPVGVAAKRLGRRFVGCDIQEKLVFEAATRLNNASTVELHKEASDEPEPTRQPRRDAVECIEV